MELSFWGETGLLAKPLIILITGKDKFDLELCAVILEDLFIQKKFSCLIRYLEGQVEACAIDYFKWNGNRDISGKKLLHTLRDAGRTYNKNLWIESCLETLTENSIFLPDILIIPDWNSSSELEYIKNLNYYQILTLEIRTFSGSKSNMSCDYIIDDFKNTKTLDSYLVSLVEELIK